LKFSHSTEQKKDQNGIESGIFEALQNNNSLTVLHMGNFFFPSKKKIDIQIHSK